MPLFCFHKWILKVRPLKLFSLARLEDPDLILLET